MSRDSLGIDDKEPWRGSHVSTREFDKLEGRFNKLDEKVDCMDKKLDRVITHIENQEKAKRDVYKKAGVLSAAIGTLVAVISRVW